MNKHSRIRNFCIIAHIDHGKSTLADRLLEKTETIPPLKMREQFLDNMELEREKGITIKLKTVRMRYKMPEKPNFYILNLIDTPGHVDFSYEVSRSLAACEGAILVVDATQGIQAQTVAHTHLALEQDLAIIPVVNKIDLENTEPEKVAKDLINTFGFKKEEIILASAKKGIGINEIFKAIIKKIPPPSGNSQEPLRALIFDSKYDLHKGVIVYIRIVDGKLVAGDQELKISFLGSKAEAEVVELGYLAPEMQPTDCLFTGEVGYIATGFKDVSLCQVGDTITEFRSPRPRQRLAEGGKNSGVRRGKIDSKIEPLPGYKKVKPMVFAGIYPAKSGDYQLLRESLGKLKLTDSALFFEVEPSSVLGQGFRGGFLGLFHLEIVRERLEREYGLDLILSTPTVEYKVKPRKAKAEKTKTISVRTAAELPDQSKIEKIFEPWVFLSIFTPQSFMGGVMELCRGFRGIFKNMEYLGQQIKLEYEIPLAEIIIDFYDRLKSVSSGYASMDYRFLDYKEADVERLDILVNNEKVEAFSQIVIKKKTYKAGKQLVKKLKEIIPRHQFKVPLQAVLGSKIIARENIPALRKNVTAKLYGGDRTRKDKLLQKQKKGKEKLKKFGKVSIPPEAFLNIFKKPS